MTVRIECPADCGGCACHIRPPCSHYENGHGEEVAQENETPSPGQKEIDEAFAIIDQEVAQAIENGGISRMMTFKEAVAHLERWKNGTDSTNFHALLYTLIAKADPSNLRGLRMGFPMEVQAYEEWQAAKSEKEFFAAFAE